MPCEDDTIPTPMRSKTSHLNITRPRIALTGATGYVGGRLAPRLLESGYPVRCLARNTQKIHSRHWANHELLETAQTDLYDIDALTNALAGCQVAYYMIHSMISAGAAYDRIDHLLANNFVKAATAAGIQRIIYLGGLGESHDELSEHLQSRRKVETTLAAGNVPVTTLRAAMIIGSGSASFEILRYLVERLPVMVTPRWVSTESQPIAIEDVLYYLQKVLETPATIGKSIDIGGSEVVTYQALMRQVASVLNLRRRLVIPVPVLTPKLSSYWIHLVTPVSAQVAQPLARGLANRVVCRNQLATQLMPHELRSPVQAIVSALEYEQANEVASSWVDAGPIPGDPDWSGGLVYTDQRKTIVYAAKRHLYKAIKTIGGGQGYYAADSLWRIRGLLDKLAGGPGLRRGRRDIKNLSYGDALDFWRVLEAEPNQRLRLFAEMKLPGTATLTFEITKDADNDQVNLVQTAHFKPRGLAGILYWYAVKPFHGFVFSGMLRGIKTEAERLDRTDSPATTV